MNIEINLFTRKGFEECVREETAHLATLKSKEYWNRKGRQVQIWDQANRQQKHGLVWKNRKKMSQIAIVAKWSIWNNWIHTSSKGFLENLL